MKVLLVDDNEAFRRFVRIVVSELAEGIQECGDGSEALGAYTKQQPDFVLMDIRMQGLNGLLATRQILKADPTAKVIILTDYDDGDFRQAASEVGACAYMLKDNLLSLLSFLATFDPPTRPVNPS